MNRGTGTGFLGLGIVLLIVGAIMRYAVTVTTEGFSINTRYVPRSGSIPAEPPSPDER